MNEETKQFLSNELHLPWAVYAECEVNNNGKIEKFDRLIAVFCYPFYAKEFIKNFLPSENVKCFKTVCLLNQ